MFFKFRPNIVFRRQERELLYLVADHGSRIVEIPNSLDFDFSSLIRGVSLDKVPTEILTVLQEENLCEIVGGSLDFVPAELSFLKKISQSEALLQEYVANIRSSCTVVLNLTRHPIRFPQLEKFSKVAVFSEISTFKDFQSGGTGPRDLVVVLTNYFNHPLLSELNRYFLDHEVSWVLVKQDFSGTTIGPYFKNGPNERHHCYQCFLNRCRGKDEVNYFTNFFQEDSALDYGISQDVELSWVEIELLKFHTGNVGKFEICLQLFDSTRSLMPLFQYLPAPLCEVCDK